MTGILKAAKDHIDLKRAEDRGVRPSAIGLHPDLFRRLSDACDDLMPSDSITLRMFKMERRHRLALPEDSIVFMAVDFFPDPNGIKAF